MVLAAHHVPRSPPIYREHVEHVLRNLEMVARLQLDRPTMTVEQLAQAVLDDIERIVGQRRLYQKGNT